MLPGEIESGGDSKTRMEKKPGKVMIIGKDPNQTDPIRHSGT